MFRAMRRASSVALLILANAITIFAQTPQQPRDARLVSPEVAADHRVTFRFRGPNCKAVAVFVRGMQRPISMQKDEQGVWSVTTEPLEPDFYIYSIIADGVPLVDPSNVLVTASLGFPASTLHVPGPPSLLWEINDVAHCQIHHHLYKSAVVGDQRNFFVYTPPGYDPSAKTRYPVLYLLHGANFDATSWIGVGFANVILDNLIAQQKAVPMVVVMPLGYGFPVSDVIALGGGGRDSDIPPAIRDQNFAKFSTALLQEVMPQVESSYAVIKDRKAHAIVGSSMGGTESLLTGLNNLDKFAWIGGLSSGGLPEEFDKDFPGLDAKANDQLRLLWIACGTEDPFLALNRGLRAWLSSKGVRHTDVEVPGAHTMMVHRRNFAKFASLLFR